MNRRTLQILPPLSPSFAIKQSRVSPCMYEGRWIGLWCCRTERWSHDGAVYSTPLFLSYTHTCVYIYISIYMIVGVMRWCDQQPPLINVQMLHRARQCLLYWYLRVISTLHSQSQHFMRCHVQIRFVGRKISHNRTTILWVISGHPIPLVCSLVLDTLSGVWKPAR